MATSNLIIHTGNYFETQDIKEVHLMSIKNPTWELVSNQGGLHRKCTLTDTELHSKWEYETRSPEDSDFKFNVIALFTYNATEDLELLSYGEYAADQLVSMSDKWELTVTSKWIIKDEEYDPESGHYVSIDFAALYNKHTVETGPNTKQLAIVHDRLVDSNALKFNSKLSTMLNAYLSRNESIDVVDQTRGLQGLNLIDYKNIDNNTSNDIDLAGRTEASAQLLVARRLKGIYYDVITLYDNTENITHINSPIERVVKGW